MACHCSRREMLGFLMLVFPASLVGHKGKDYFDRELVCVHVYDLARDLPEPLLEKPASIESRSKSKHHFEIGLPELILCRTRDKLLHMFKHFWPLSRAEIQQMRQSIRVVYELPVIERMDSLDEFKGISDKQRQIRETGQGFLAVIWTMNDYTRSGSSSLIDICRGSGVAELVIFKDPSRPPYLCAHPSQQKGFKRPPPYSPSSGYKATR